MFSIASIVMILHFLARVDYLFFCRATTWQQRVQYHILATHFYDGDRFHLKLFFLFGLNLGFINLSSFLLKFICIWMAATRVLLQQWISIEDFIWPIRESFFFFIISVTKTDDRRKSAHIVYTNNELALDICLRADKQIPIKPQSGRICIENP